MLLSPRQVHERYKYLKSNLVASLREYAEERAEGLLSQSPNLSVINHDYHHDPSVALLHT